MNKSNAKNLINNLSSGMYDGHDWFGPSRAIVYFTTGYARDTVADHGLSPLYNSGAQVQAQAVVTDRYILKALRKAYPPEYKVKMQSITGSELFSDWEGYPSDWVTENRPEPEAVLNTREAAVELAALVVRRGYAQPTVVLRR